MINNPLIDTYFVSNRQVSEFTNDERIELINEFIELDNSLPSSFLIYFINELSEDVLIENLLLQKKEYYKFYKYADENEFEEEILKFLKNEIETISSDNWYDADNLTLLNSNIIFGLNVLTRYKVYENQVQFLFINKNWMYNHQYLNKSYNLVLTTLTELKQETKSIINKKYDYPLLSESPFTDNRHYEIFKIISSNFNFEEKKMWTVLFEYLKENVKPKMNISELKYFEFVNRKIIKSEISTRTQKGVNSESYFESFDDFLNNISPN